MTPSPSAILAIEQARMRAHQAANVAFDGLVRYELFRGRVALAIERLQAADSTEEVVAWLERAMEDVTAAES